MGQLELKFCHHLFNRYYSPT